MCHSITRYLKKPTPSENRLTAILNRKSPSQTGDSNLAWSDRMTLLYHLRHRHCQELPKVIQLVVITQFKCLKSRLHDRLELFKTTVSFCPTVQIFRSLFL